MDGAFLVDDAAGLPRSRTGVALHHGDALHDDAFLVDQNAQHFAFLALVAAGQDYHFVAFLDLGHDLEHLGCERDDFHELPRPQLARHGAEDARADRLVLVVDQHGGVAVEADGAAVGAADGLGGAHDHRLVHVAFLHPAARDGFFDRDHDDIAHGGPAAHRATQHLDALHAAGA